MLNETTIFLLILVALVFSAVASAMVNRKFSKFSQVPTEKGITGGQAARMILDGAGLNDVRIECSHGHLSDHYDPSNRVLRLSQGVMNSSSIAAVGVAAHEAGHAIQHKEQYAPLMLRTLCAQTTGIGSRLAWPLFLIGLVFSFEPLIYAGILLYTLIFLFTLITLPVEYNASNRAMACLTDYGILTHYETHGAREVLSAAAKTYVASALMAALQLLRILSIANRGRSRD